MRDVTNAQWVCAYVRHDVLLEPVSHITATQDMLQQSCVGMLARLVQRPIYVWTEIITRLCLAMSKATLGAPKWLRPPFTWTCQC